MKQMTEAQLEALAYAFKLKEDLLLWSEIVEKVNARGFVNSGGQPYTEDALIYSYHQFKKGKLPKFDRYIARLKTESKRDKQPSATDNPGAQEGGTLSPDTLTRQETIQMMQQLETRLTTMIDTKLKAAMEASGPRMSLDKEAPPLPPKGGEYGRKFEGQKDDLRARIDSVLFRLLDRECNRDFNGNMSRCMDAVLWRYFGKPKLSFEE